jgi:hypothetical protein
MKKINVTTDTLGHKGDPGKPVEVEPCKKVKLATKLGPIEIRALLEKKRRELSTKEKP